MKPKFEVIFDGSSASQFEWKILRRRGKKEAPTVISGFHSPAIAQAFVELANRAAFVEEGEKAPEKPVRKKRGPYKKRFPKINKPVKGPVKSAASKAVPAKKKRQYRFRELTVKNTAPKLWSSSF